jgi:predicted metal-dependent phosphotriesterase family hydrolase
MAKVWNATHFLTRIAPRLRDGGATDAQIDALLLDNPRRFFAGEAPRRLA